MRSLWLIVALAAGAWLATGSPARAGIAAGRPGDWRSLTTGRLRNGVRYAILARHGHEPGAGVLMRDEGGFIAERRPGERGLAHLIEHIAFLSPTTGSPDDRRHLPHQGHRVTLDAPSAGTTSWRETNYFLSTTGTDIATVDTVLGLLREVATDLTLRPDTVDEARRQVVDEMAGRRLGNELYAGFVAAVAPGSPNDVIDAQNSDDVPTATVDTIRALYRRLYRPGNIMVVVVGDVDPTEVARRIRRRFGGWTRADARPGRATPPGFRPGPVAPISYSARPQGRQVAMMTVTLPPPPPHSRRGQAAAMLMDLLAMQAVDDRLARARPDGTPGTGKLVIQDREQGYRQLMLFDGIAGPEWRPAVAGLFATSCDLLTTGFSEQAWDLAKAEVVRALEAGAAAMPMTANVELAKDLSHALADGERLIPPDDLLAFARVQLPRITARAGSRWWRRQWRADLAHLRVETADPTPLDEPLAAVRAAADGAVAAGACKVRP